MYIRDPAVVEESLDSAENVGVLPYLMKMAIAQAINKHKHIQNTQQLNT